MNFNKINDKRFWGGLNALSGDFKRMKIILRILHLNSLDAYIYNVPNWIRVKYFILVLYKDSLDGINKKWVELICLLLIITMILYLVRIILLVFAELLNNYCKECLGLLNAIKVTISWKINYNIDCKISFYQKNVTAHFCKTYDTSIKVCALK